VPESTPDRPAEERVQIQEFATWLLAVNEGVTHAELTDALPRLVRTTLETGKPSGLTLKIAVKPLSGNTSQIQVVAQVEEKLPKADPAQTLMFADASGNLTRDNPRALTIPGLGVYSASTPTRVIGAPREDQ
jgi:hypothetical protein